MAIRVGYEPKELDDVILIEQPRSVKQSPARQIVHSGDAMDDLRERVCGQVGKEYYLGFNARYVPSRVAVVHFPRDWKGLIWACSGFKPWIKHFCACEKGRDRIADQFAVVENCLDVRQMARIVFFEKQSRRYGIDVDYEIRCM